MFLQMKLQGFGACMHSSTSRGRGGDRKSERQREREFDPVASNSIRGNDETDRLGLHFSDECVGSPPT